jgi:hypothetical protein
MTRRADSPANEPDALNGLSRRAMLGTAGLAAAAILAPAVAAAKEDDKERVVPAPVYSPAPYHREIDLAGKNIVIG